MWDGCCERGVCTRAYLFARRGAFSVSLAPPSRPALPPNNNAARVRVCATVANTLCAASTRASRGPSAWCPRRYRPQKAFALRIAREVCTDLRFWRFLVLVILLVGVRIVFRHLDATFPVYVHTLCLRWQASRLGPPAHARLERDGVCAATRCSFKPRPRCRPSGTVSHVTALALSLTHTKRPVVAVWDFL